jgi:hypothetical protein
MSSIFVRRIFALAIVLYPKFLCCGNPVALCTETLYRTSKVHSPEMEFQISSSRIMDVSSAVKSSRSLQRNTDLHIVHQALPIHNRMGKQKELYKLSKESQRSVQSATGLPQHRNFGYRTIAAQIFEEDIWNSISGECTFDVRYSVFTR